jgi:hypothetical protein
MWNWEWGREEMWVPNSKRNETFIKRDSLWIEAAVHSSIEQRKHNFTAVKYEVLVSFCVCVHIYIPAVAIPFRIESVLPVSESGWATARALTYLDLHRERDETLNGNQSECTRLRWVLALFFSAPLLTGAQPEWFSWKEKEGSKMWISLFMQC